MGVVVVEQTVLGCEVVWGGPRRRGTDGAGGGGEGCAAVERMALGGRIGGFGAPRKVRS